MFEIKILILEYNTGTYEGNKYANIVARYGNKLLKFKLSKDVPDLTPYIDDYVIATASIVSGQNMGAVLKIDSVKPE